MRRGITYDDGDHPENHFSSCEPSGEHQNGDGDGYGGDGEVELGVILVGDNDDELNSEAEEEEEIEFKQGHVNLLRWADASAFPIEQSRPTPAWHPAPDMSTVSSSDANRH